jgi:hypothetical protein
MKTSKSILVSLVLILSVSVSVMAQNEAKIIAVVNKASWCHVCEENGERAMAAFMANNTDNVFLFVGNDLSTGETKKSSLEEIKKLGLDTAVADLKYTGMVYFFNAQTKELIHQVSVAKSDVEIATAMVTAKNAVK